MTLNKFFWLSPLAVVAYDAAASVASLSLGFAYAYAGIGSAIIYAVAGFLSARISGFLAGILVGVIMGLVDATIGWGVSWAIGPGRPSSGAISASQWLVAASSVTIIAVICASIGGLVAHVLQSRSVA